jgi:uncharacterized membrane protein YoaK (UPF0700 family)
MGASSSGKTQVAVLLGVNGGYVDTVGFLALQGLFTAHVTGNFVTLWASLILGTSGALAKLLALPTFCAAIVIARALGHLLRARGRPALRTLLAVKAALLAAAAALALRFGPFPNGDAWETLLTGQLLVAGMAVQNAVHRVHLGDVPPSTVMTGTTTQLMIDIADWFRHIPHEVKQPIAARIRRYGTATGAFVTGCAAGALLFAKTGMWCFLVPLLLGLITVRYQTRFESEAG